jgi:hypothetical protein
MKIIFFLLTILISSVVSAQSDVNVVKFFPSIWLRTQADSLTKTKTYVIFEKSGKVIFLIKMEDLIEDFPMPDIRKEYVRVINEVIPQNEIVMMDSKKDLIQRKVLSITDTEMIWEFLSGDKQTFKRIK